jgi:flagellin-like protein
MKRRLSRSSQALSEIVGALILTLIVVVAASAFATFVAQRQKEVQAQETYNLLVSQESLRITSIAHTINVGPPVTWATITFSLVSLHQHDSKISYIEIKDSALKQWDVTRSDGTTTTETPYTHMRITAREQVSIKVNIPADFYDATIVISDIEPVKINVITDYSNNFTRTFIPPIAIGLVKVESYWNPAPPPGAFSQYYILDGTPSLGPAGSAVIKWGWTVTQTGPPPPPPLSPPVTYSGAKAVAPMISGGIYTIDLIVTDEYGMTGSYSFSYTA